MNNEETEHRVVLTKPRCKKLKHRIDLAAMVSISFLLIIFFMVTKEMARPQAMDLGVPENGCGGCGGCYFGSPITRTITFILDGKNTLISYKGLLNNPEVHAKKIAYGKDGVRKELLLFDSQVKQFTHDNNKGSIVIIKPSKECNYGNLVDILDEMQIAKIGTYAVVDDLTPEEQKLLASN